MKSEFFIILGLFFLSGSNNFVKCCNVSKENQAKCAVCEETPCQCEELISERNNNKISLRKLILSFINKVNPKGSDGSAFQECKHCQNACPKKQGVAKLLADILRRTCTCEKEEEAIKEIILQLLDPSECERKPCQPHCDPQIQKLLRAILKKAVGCECTDCPSNCDMYPSRCDREEYKYWFRTRRETIRKEISDNYAPKPNTVCPQKEEQSTSCPDVKKSKKYIKNKEVYKCASDNCKKCKTCQRPNQLICPRYVTEDCPLRNRADSFSVCTDCNNCRLVPAIKKNYAVLFCGGCKAVNSPFVQFTPNGNPFKQEPERHNGIQVTTKFLQINDLSQSEAKSLTTVFNPFLPKCNGPRKKKYRERKKKVPH